MFREATLWAKISTDVATAFSHRRRTPRSSLPPFVIKAVKNSHGVTASAQSLNHDQCSACEEFFLVLASLIFWDTQADESAEQTASRGTRNSAAQHSRQESGR